MTRPGWFAWLGASLVWTGAAIMSFSGLNGLARTCYIAGDISWLLPLVIDVGVAVAAWVWRRGANEDAARLAGRMTWSLLVLTITGNGAHLGMEASHVTPPWWVAALVGAIPPAVAGATAHLLVLLGRDEAAEKIPADIPAPSVLPVAPKLAGNPSPSKVTTTALPVKDRPVSERASVPTDPDTLISKTRELLPIGRRALSVKLDVSEHTARELLKTVKANNGHRVLEDAK